MCAVCITEILLAKASKAAQQFLQFGYTQVQWRRGRGGQGGGHGPPGKNLSDNFDACWKFLKFLFVKFKICSFHKYYVL